MSMDIRWAEKEDMPTDSFKIADIGDDWVDIDDNYRFLRIRDILFAPRVSEMMLVLATPLSRRIPVLRHFGSSRDIETISVALASEIFGVSHKTMQNWCSQGIIPAIKRRYWHIYESCIPDIHFASYIGDDIMLMAPAMEEKH